MDDNTVEKRSAILGQQIHKAIHLLLAGRDELTLRSVRGNKWYAWLLFPLAIIVGSMRAGNVDVSFLGLQSNSWVFIFYGLGWTIFLFLPPRWIPYIFRISIVASAVLLGLQFLCPPDTGTFGLFLYYAFQFVNGSCVAVGLFIYMFSLRNVERLVGIVVLELWYVIVDDMIYYWIDLPAAFNDWGSVIISIFLIVFVFRCREDDIPIAELRKEKAHRKKEERLKPEEKGSGKIKGAGYLIFLFDICYFAIGTMHYYINYTDVYEFSLKFDVASLIGIAVLLILMLQFSRSSIQLWNIFLVMSLVAFTCFLVNTPISVNIGTFAYGFGDAVGYIMVQYMIGCVGRKHRSIGFFHVACLVCFMEYVVCTIFLDGIFTISPAQEQITAFAIVIIIVAISFLMMPFFVNRFFGTDWVEEFQGFDMTLFAEKYAEEIEKVEEYEYSHLDELHLTKREQEIMTLLLTNKPPKAIAAELYVSRSTVDFHTNNLYRKLNISSRTELFLSVQGGAEKSINEPE